ncbi:hypothetical protein A6R68_02787 [Neotoma lepida]|uniref:Uncharacterized protein n=1 Tax=Neotoma lepida TaxID=56216 RepID=A0A1A6GRZ7_NEOLE|nr:hypothetical protein A6R68_02787 [Neotoma lepida]
MESSGPGSYRSAVRRPLHSAQAVDVASASSFRAFEILHLHLDLRAEFGPPGPGPGSRGLSGTVMLELRCLLPEGASELRLDSHSCLEVTAATLRRGQPGDQQQLAEPVPFHTQPFSHYGQALCVAFPQPCRADERFQLELTYRVGEGPGVPDGFTAVMSASTWEKRGPNKFFFQMCQPIPSYLIALAIGDLASAEVGPSSEGSGVFYKVHYKPQVV